MIGQWVTFAKPFIMKYEGFSPDPYLCPAGKWTIGYGTTRYPNGKAVQKGDPRITEAVGETYLEFSMDRVHADLMKLVHVSLTAHEEAALVCLAYNVGLGVHDGVKGDLADSTLLAKLNAGDQAGAADQFLPWDKAHVKGEVVVLPGLKTRRIAERAMFLSS